MSAYLYLSVLGCLLYLSYLYLSLLTPYRPLSLPGIVTLIDYCRYTGLCEPIAESEMQIENAEIIL